MSKLIAILILLPFGLIVAETTFVRTPTADSRITRIYCDMWGEPGTNLCWGPIVPDGEVWLIKSGGIDTDSGEYFEAMMNIAVTGPNPNFPYRETRPIVPLTRYPGTAMGTPVLAINQQVILEAGESLVSRACGVAPDKRIGLRFMGWAFPESMLPYLLGLPKSESLMSAEELAIKQLGARFQ